MAIASMKGKLISVIGDEVRFIATFLMDEFRSLSDVPWYLFTCLRLSQVLGPFYGTGRDRCCDV